MAGGLAADLQVAGSDFLEAVFEPLRESAPVAEGETVTWTFAGSSPAMAALRGGQAGLALVAFPPNQVPSADLFLAVPLGFQVAVVAVHASNPLPEISLEQLRRAFGSTSGASQWSGLGLRGAWESRAISAQVMDRPDHLAAEIFRTAVLPKESWRAGVMMTGETDTIYLRLAEDAGVLAILPMAPPEGRGKVLAVTADRPGYAFGPSMENVAIGDYPLRLPFYAVVNRADVEKWKPWLRWLASDAVAEALAAAGYVPVPPATRRQRVLELDLAR